MIGTWIITATFVLFSRLAGGSEVSISLDEIVANDPLWLQSSYISFCKSAIYVQTFESCEKVGLKFNQKLCKCIDDPRENPNKKMVSKVRSNNGGLPNVFDNGQGRIDFNTYFYDHYYLKGHALPELRCNALPSAVRIPQPAEVRLMPGAFIGLQCVGTLNAEGKQCVAKETYTVQVEVHVLKGTIPPYQLMDDNRKMININLPKTCALAYVSESCPPSKFMVANKNTTSCRCKSVFDCQKPLVWSEENCQCQCPLTRASCNNGLIPDMVNCLCKGDGGRFNSARDLIVSNANTTPKTTLAPETAKPISLINSPPSHEALRCALRSGECGFWGRPEFDYAISKCFCSCTKSISSSICNIFNKPRKYLP